ncbi:MAG: hypothetical protein GWO02_11990 [Gammaproteobacteria bacterium]|nr:hypothetical protein [Gammaproteobacteria bacterium]
MPDVRPDQGHATTKLGLAAGVEDGRGFTELRWRPAYHDLLDPDAGYTEGAQIELLDLTLRAREGESRVALQSLDLVDIVSLTPRTDLFHPFSWSARLGWQRRLPQGSDDDRGLLFDVTVGGGVTYRPTAHTRVYALAQVQTAVDRELDEGYALAAGARLGMLIDPLPGWRVSLEVDTLDGLGGTDPERRRASLAQRMTVTRNLALDLTVRRTEELGLEYDEATLGVNWYF